MLAILLKSREGKTEANLFRRTLDVMVPFYTIIIIFTENVGTKYTKFYKIITLLYTISTIS